MAARRLNDFSKFFRRGSLPWRTSCEVNPTMSLFCRRCGSRGTMTLSRTPCHMCLLSGMKFNWKMLSSKFTTNFYMFAMPQVKIHNWIGLQWTHEWRAVLRLRGGAASGRLLRPCHFEQVYRGKILIQAILGEKQIIALSCPDYPSN